jgi:hypothetical protein
MDKMIVASFMIFHIRKKMQDLLTLASVAEPCLCLMDTDSDPDPAFSSLTFKMPTKTNLKKFFCLLLFEGTFTSFSKIKSQKEVTKQSESRFFLLFLGLGSRRPKNIRIRQFRIRILNTDPSPLLLLWGRRCTR